MFIGALVSFAAQYNFIINGWMECIYTMLQKFVYNVSRFCVLIFLIKFYNYVPLYSSEIIFLNS